MEGGVSIDDDDGVVRTQSKGLVEGAEGVVADLIEARDAAIGSHGDEQRGELRIRGLACVGVLWRRSEPDGSGQLENLRIGVVHAQTDGVGWVGLGEHRGQAAGQVPGGVGGDDHHDTMFGSGVHENSA